MCVFKLIDLIVIKILGKVLCRGNDVINEVGRYADIHRRKEDEKREKKGGIFLRFIKCRHFHGDVADKN